VRIALTVAPPEAPSDAGDREAPDWAIVDARHVRVRVDRSAPASRRIYAISVTAIDAADQASAPRTVTT